MNGLGPWVCKVPGQHMCQDLGTLVGRKSFRTALHVKRLDWGTHVLLRAKKKQGEVGQGGPLSECVTDEE